jgi:hypothetical protein
MLNDLRVRERLARVRRHGPYIRTGKTPYRHFLGVKWSELKSCMPAKASIGLLLDSSLALC